MSSSVNVVVLVEGPTELQFIKQLLAPYMAKLGVFFSPPILGKPGEKGGDVKFSRAKNDIEMHLKQRKDTWITLLVDYYGIGGDWPGYAESKDQSDHTKKAEIMNRATGEEVRKQFPGLNTARRFIPYVSMHETEALYFSDPACLARRLKVDQRHVDAILAECGEPEKVNDHFETAPSKRLKKLSTSFKKTTTGIAIATEIGIPTMRSSCPLFDAWLTDLESLIPKLSGNR